MMSHDCLFKTRLGFAVLLLPSLVFLGLGCDSNPAPPPSFIDQSIVLEASPLVSGTETAPNEYTFDLSSLSMVVNQAFNEIEISYVTFNSADQAVFIRNFDVGRWDQVGLLQPGSLDVITTHRHTVRDLHGDAQPYVSIEGLVMLLSEGEPSLEATPMEVRVLRLREDYWAVRPIGEDNVDIFDGLTFDGTHFWASGARDRLYMMNGEGSIVSEFRPPVVNLFDLASDGESLWLADSHDSPGRILKMSLDGVVIGEFTVPTDRPGGLAWGDGSLWLSEYFGPDLRTFRIDPDASLVSGTAVVTDVFQTPGGESEALAWNGEHLLILSDALYVVTVDGTVIDSYALPVVYPMGLAWDGHAVALFSRGPALVGNDGGKLNRFRLR